MNTGNFLALDVGAVRIGVAFAHATARLPAVYGVLNNDAEVWESLMRIIRDTEATTVVVGLPRNLNGDDTSQTIAARQFADEASKQLHVEVELQDEALTSQKAETELRGRGKPYNKEDIDALAAVYILDDYLGGGRVGE